MNEFKEDIDQIHSGGDELVSMIGEPDQAEVKRNVDDLDNVWTHLNKQWGDRQKALSEALNKATSFQEELMVHLHRKSVWLYCGKHLSIMVYHGITVFFFFDEV